jgi:hypothetical protein
MKKIILTLLGVMTLSLSSMVNAALISGTGDASSEGSFASIIIPGPGEVTDTVGTNSGQQGFDEEQGVLTSSVYLTDQGSIAARTRVDSHMIFLNSPDDDSPYDLIEHFNVLWTFDGAILGVMSDQSGTYEGASTPQLGLSGTTYDIFSNRGLEDNDANEGYVLMGALGVANSMTVDMRVTQPGDWIRVVTQSSVVPVPAAIWLFGTALLGFVGMSRKTKVGGITA